MIKTSVAVFRLCSVTGISLFICLQLASFLIMFAIVDVFVISGTQEKKKNIRHNSLPMFYNGAALGASLKPNTMDSSEDAVNKLWEQSISYNGTINFNLADGGQEDAGCWLFFFSVLFGRDKQERGWTSLCCFLIWRAEMLYIAGILLEKMKNALIES